MRQARPAAGLLAAAALLLLSALAAAQQQAAAANGTAGAATLAPPAVLLAATGGGGAPAADVAGAPAVSAQGLSGAAAAAALSALPPARVAALATKLGAAASDLRATLESDASLRFYPDSLALVYACALGPPDLAAALAKGRSAAAVAAGAPSTRRLVRVLGPDADHAGHSHSAAAAAAVPAGAASASAAAAPASAAALTAAAAVSPRDIIPPGQADPPISDVFKLHSRPGAATFIYLDFNGHVTTGTWWNKPASQNGGGYAATITTPPFSLDSDPAFSDEERRAMVAIWRGVSEDYAPFSVDVTTELPNKTFVGSGIRIAIGGNSNDWYTTGGSGAGGVNLVGEFGKSTYGGGPGDNEVPPGFVFPANLALNVKYIWDAASHEAGHSFGLWHHGNSTNDYYQGHGTWGPIMGNPYLKPVVQWSHGEYPGANKPNQDDVGLIAAKVGLVPDDIGNVTQTARTLPYPGAYSGIISYGGDADVFAFRGIKGDVFQGQLLLADGFLNSNKTLQPRSDLDAEVVLMNSFGGVLQRWSSTTGLLQGTLTATRAFPSNATYYVSVTGVGQAGVGSGDYGYSNYASGGSYTIRVGDAPTSTCTAVFIRDDTPPPPPQLSQVPGDRSCPAGWRLVTENEVGEWGDRVWAAMPDPGLTRLADADDGTQRVVDPTYQYIYIPDPTDTITNSLCANIPIPAVVTELALNEVKLFDRTGAQIPPSALNISMSTNVVGLGERSAPGCFDNDTSALGCSTSTSDAAPSLSIGFACPGSGLAALSRIHVYAAGGGGGVNGYMVQLLSPFGASELRYVFKADTPLQKVKVGDVPPCDANNGGCSALATCAPGASGAPVCTCMPWSASGPGTCSGAADLQWIRANNSGLVVQVSGVDAAAVAALRAAFPMRGAIAAAAAAAAASGNATAAPRRVAVKVSAGAPLEMGDWLDGDHQKWTLRDDGRITSAAGGPGLCVEVADAGGAGSAVRIAACSGLPHQAWSQDANGRLRPGHDRDLCLDTLGQDVAPAGAAVVVTDCFEDPEPSQVFQLAFTCPGGAERSANGTCVCVSPGQEMLNGVCLTRCPADAARDPVNKTCVCLSSDKELVNGVCMPTCGAGSLRGPDGVACVCLPGYGGAGCPPCRVGTYSSGGLANNPTRACSPCPVNLVTPAPGAVWSTQCTVCKAGYGGPNCTICAASTYSPGGTAQTARQACTPCPTNTMTPALGSTASANCTLCRPGYGGSACSMCAPGKYSLGGSKRVPRPSCLDCGSGTASLSPGSTNCTACTGGYGGPKCTICQPDSFSLGGNATMLRPPCQACPVESTSVLPGSLNCPVCRPGFGGRPLCALCGNGTFSPGGNASFAKPLCQPCPSGSTTVMPGSSDCSVCQPGFGGPSCNACPAGAWSAGGRRLTPQGSCSACVNAGTTTAASGASSSSLCTICKPGHAGPDCSPCPVGQWSAGGTAGAPKPAACIACAPNSTTLRNATTSDKGCALCAPGYGAITPSAPCALCPVDTWSAGGNGTVAKPQCTACPTKMATAGPGAFNPRNCSKVVALKRWQAGLRR